MLGKEKKQIRENDAIYFLQKVGDDMFQIKNETDIKLIADVGEKEEITKEDIDAITSGEVQDKIFDLVDAIARGNKPAALGYYNDLITFKRTTNAYFISNRASISDSSYYFQYAHTSQTR